ncbi:hypothetical protein ACFQVC_22050 [Streptomyces monticola]|uniref:EfeO-type cupredoxin-like domain-containing protein n=1 Tax=Streptomyces monticola TaxID=2666263 RepID=A0ABW2JN84_9ACTN
MRRGIPAAAVVLLALLATATGCTDRPTTHHKPGTGHEQADGPVGELLKRKDESGHRYRQVDEQGAPDVGLSLRPDAEDGWNVRLAVRNFRFTPDSVGGAALPGSGHAYLYLDGHKIARLYGTWYHLPGNLVPRGTHRLTARLHADDHTVWAVDGKAVESTADLTDSGAESGAAAGAGSGSDAGSGSGEGSGSGTDSGSGAGRADPEQGGAVDRTVTVTVTDGRVQPPPGRVELDQGDRVRLKVTSDRTDTLHVHGYDKEAALRAGEPGTLTFTADRTGLFEVETHGSGLVLTQLVVR